MRLAVLEVVHETNSFSPMPATDIRLAGGPYRCVSSGVRGFASTTSTGKRRSIARLGWGRNIPGPAARRVMQVVAASPTRGQSFVGLLQKVQRFTLEG